MGHTPSAYAGLAPTAPAGETGARQSDGENRLITSANGGRVGVGVTTGTATGAKFTLRKLGVINAVATCLPRVGPVTLGVAFCIEERVGERALWQEIHVYPPSRAKQQLSWQAHPPSSDALGEFHQ